MILVLTHYAIMRTMGGRVFILQVELSSDHTMSCMETTMYDKQTATLDTEVMAGTYINERFAFPLLFLFTKSLNLPSYCGAHLCFPHACQFVMSIKECDSHKRCLWVKITYAAVNRFMTRYVSAGGFMLQYRNASPAERTGILEQWALRSSTPAPKSLVTWSFWYLLWEGCIYPKRSEMYCAFYHSYYPSLSADPVAALWRGSEQSESDGQVFQQPQ